MHSETIIIKNTAKGHHISQHQMKENVLLHAVLPELRELADASDREKGRGTERLKCSSSKEFNLPAPLEKEISKREGRQQAVTSDSLNPESFAKVLDKSVIDYTRIFI